MIVRSGFLSVGLVLVLSISTRAAVLSDGSPNPNDVDLLMWLKADSLALANGANVTQWNDSSDKGHHMYGGVGAGYPTFVTGILNSLPTVRFDGTPRNLTNGNGTNAVVLNQEHTIIVVGHSQKTVVDAGLNDAFLSYAPYLNGGIHQPTSTEMVVAQISATKTFRMRYPGIDTGISPANSELVNPAIYTQVRANTTNARAYVNKVTPPWLNITSPSTDFSTVGQVFRIGQHTYAAQYLKGDLFEILVYNRALGVLELQEVYDYLNTKWFGAPGPAQVVLQADFKGTGSGTGGATDIVTLGGTAVTFADSSAAATASIATATPLVTTPLSSTGYLNLSDTGTGTVNRACGVRFTPASASNSPDVWYRNRGSSNFDLVNGGFDFLYRNTSASSAWIIDALYPLDIDGGASGLRLIMKAPAANTLRVQLQAKNSANTVVKDLIANATVSLAANTVYHIGVTAQTDATGIVTIKLFVQPGNAPLDTSATPQASASSSGALDSAATNAVNHGFNSVPTFRLGQMSNPVGTKTLAFDAFRVYSNVPTTFEAFELYPDLVGVAKPNPEPTYPSGFDLFTPPVSASAPAADTPTFAEWIRTGTAGDAMVATGDKFSTFTGVDEAKDTRFVSHGQTPKGLSTSSASIYRFDGNKVAFGLDATIPKWSMYFLWPRNANGYGRPVAVNQTEAWWLGPKEATRGETTSVFGRNLSHDNGTSTAWIYAKPITGGGSAQFITPTAVNPYKVDFVVPASFTNGTYEIWAHNGHGRGYGWSGPLTLTVSNGTTWTGATYNVTTYGATGGDTTDDTATITAAINAAKAAATVSNPTTVFFPAGTYYLTNQLFPGSNVRLLGAGKTTSHLVARNLTATGAFGTGGMIEYVGVINNEIADIHLDAGLALNPSGSSWFIFGGDPINFRVRNTSITAVGDKNQFLGYFTDGGIPLNGYRIFFQDCDLSGSTLIFVRCTQLFIDRCNFRGIGDRDLIYTAPCRDYSVTRCTGQDYDNSSPTGIGWSNGRFCFAGNGLWSARNMYWGDNTTKDLGARSGSPYGQNQGEQICFDVGGGHILATPTATSASSVTFASPPNPGVEVQAVIVAGKGAGQWRTVTSYNIGTGVFNISPNWNVIPDTTTSVIAIGCYNERAVAYRNHLDGKLAQVIQEEHTASSGIAPFAGTTNMVADGNIITECRRGIIVMGRGMGNNPETTPSCFSLFTNNLIQTSREPLHLISYTDDDFPSASYLFGQVFRGNTMAGAVTGNIFVANSGANSYATDMMVLDRTVSTDVPNPIGLYYNPSKSWLGSLIFTGSYMDRGAAAYSGSKAVSFFATANKMGLFNNSWLNYETLYGVYPSPPDGNPNYGGTTLPGPIPEVPYRVLNVTGKVGGSSQTTSLMVQNAGTADLTWDKMLVGSWLSVSPASGTTSNAVKDGGKSTITVTCNPSGLTANIYTGTINVKEGVNIKKVATVVFMVNP